MDNMMIKEAAKRLGVEAHVLRYWEDELGLEIKRNSMGHRYYDERDVMLFNKVKELKENGLALKDIKHAIVKQRRQKEKCIEEKRDEQKENNEKTCEKNTLEIDKIEKSTHEKGETHKSVCEKAAPEENDDALSEIKIVDFKQAQIQALMNKIVANAFHENKSIITTSIKEEITSDVMRQFDTVMREKEEKEEARFKKIDDYLRQLQQVNSEVAATKSRRLFKRK